MLCLFESSTLLIDILILMLNNWSRIYKNNKHFEILPNLSVVSSKKFRNIIMVILKLFQSSPLKFLQNSKKDLVKWSVFHILLN